MNSIESRLSSVLSGSWLFVLRGLAVLIFGILIAAAICLRREARSFVRRIAHA